MRFEIFLFLMWLGLIYAYNVKNVDSQDVIFLKNRRQGNNFGHSVALAKNYIYVGAPHDDIHGNVFKCRFNANYLKQQDPPCSDIDGKSSKEMSLKIQVSTNPLNLSWSHDKTVKQKSIWHDSHCFE